MTDVRGDAIATTEKPDSLRRKVEFLRKRAFGSIEQTKAVTDDYTIVAEDAANLLLFTAATGKTMTVPITLPVGWWCCLMQLGAGAATFTPASGASVDSVTATETTGGQYSKVWLEVVANSDGQSAAAVVSGDLST